MRSLSRALGNLRNYWPTAIGAMAGFLVVNAANLVTPQLLRILIDQGITPLDLNRVWYVAGGLVVIAIFRGISNFLQGYWSEVTSQGVAYDLRNIIFEKLQQLSFSYHDRAQTGKLMTHMTSDVELVRMFVGTGLIQMLSAIVMLFGTIVIMQENLAGARVIKAFAQEQYEVERYGRQNEELFGINIELMRIFTTFFPLTFFIANLGMVAVIWIGGLEVIGQSLTLGDLVAFTGYFGFLLMPMFMVGMIGSMFSRAEASAQRIYEVIDAESEVQEKPNAILLPFLKGRVAFKNVSFRYIGSQEDVLQDVSFIAEPGQTVAILGKTGSGKSTIINLIPRFYDVTKGHVFIDGYDVKEITIDSLRSQIGIVLQESALFSGSIRENIAYGRPDATFDNIVKVAKVAQAHEFILELPEGYDTVIGERGVGLSGGQKQRVAIARALLVDPRILILDDSTSSVDSETEFKIQLALSELMQNRTCFVIAQRIGTVRNADLILLLDDQKLVAKGTHDQLLRTSELYAEILASQFGERDELIAAVEEEMTL